VRRLLPALCLAAALAAAGCSGLGVRSDDAATVNGVGIPNSRLSEMVKAQLGEQQQGQQAQDIEGITRQALEGLIQFQIVLDAARDAGVTVEEGAVDARMEQLKSQVAAQGQDYQQLLRDRNISETVLRDQQRVQLAVDLVAVKLVPYRPDAELLKTLDRRKAEFIQVHVRHVLVKDKQAAAAARRELLDSGDWSAVARRRSIDPQSKDKAGDLGFSSKGQTVKPFEQAEFGLARQGNCKGRTSGSCESPISQPVKTQYGFHVLQVIGVRLPPLNNDLRSKLDPSITQRRQQAVETWFSDQVKHADVAVNPRYGRWDEDAGKVVPRETAPGPATTSPGATPAAPSTSQP
jgi:parvulin-like peptidyl-prolyl isomerase